MEAMKKAIKRKSAKPTTAKGAAPVVGAGRGTVIACVTF